MRTGGNIPRCWFLPAFLYTPELSEPGDMARFEGELCDNILLGSEARLPTRYGNFQIHAFVCPFTGKSTSPPGRGRSRGSRTAPCALTRDGGPAECSVRSRSASADRLAAR